MLTSNTEEKPRMSWFYGVWVAMMCIAGTLRMNHWLLAPAICLNPFYGLPWKIDFVYAHGLPSHFVWRDRYMHTCQHKPIICDNNYTCSIPKNWMKWYLFTSNGIVCRDRCIRCFFQCQNCESALWQLPPQTWLHLSEVEVYNHVPICMPMCQLYGSDCVIHTTCEKLLFTNHRILKYAVPPACCPHTCVLNWWTACAQSIRECTRRTSTAIIWLRPAILLRRTPWPRQIYAKAIY